MKVLMLGPGRKVKGGISSVVNNYYEAGIDKLVNLKYLSTMLDGSIVLKLFTAFAAYVKFFFTIHKYDLIHVHMASRASFYRKSGFIHISKKLNKKIVIHMHGGGFEKFYKSECSKKKQAYIQKTLNHADRIIVLSKSWEKFFKEIVKESGKLLVFYNTVPVNQVEKNYNNVELLFLGSICKEKGIYDVLEVLPDIIKKYQTVKFYIGGDGEKDKLTTTIQQMKLQDNVKYLGWITGKEKERYLQHSTIYLLPSYFEGLPISLLEAMSFKCAVIATNVGGIPEVINHKDNGLLFFPGDKVKLKEYLLMLVENSELRKSIAEAGYINVYSKYNSDQAINTLKNLYDQVLSN